MEVGGWGEGDNAYACFLSLSALFGGRQGQCSSDVKFYIGESAKKVQENFIISISGDMMLS